MKCDTCHKECNRLIIDSYGAACADCRGLSECGGVSITNILTRSSERVRAQQQDYEGDMIVPHVFDKTLGQVVPNPDFVDRYADQLPTYFTQKELERAGYSKASKIYDKKAEMEAEVARERSEVEYATEGADEKITEVINDI